MRRIIGVVLVGWLSAAAPGIAQDSGDLELNLFATGSWHSENKFEIGFPQSVTPIQQSFKFKQGLGGGVRLNVFNSGHWGEEFSYSYENNNARFITNTAPSSELELGMQIHQFSVNTLYYIDADETLTVRPFFVIGIGGTLYRPTDEAKSIARDPLRGSLAGFRESAQFGLNYGFGLIAHASNSVGFRFDLKGLLSRTPTFGLPRQSDDPNATVFPAGGAFHTAEVSAGLIFYLD